MLEYTKALETIADKKVDAMYTAYRKQDDRYTKAGGSVADLGAVLAVVYSEPKAASVLDVLVDARWNNKF